MGVYVENYRDFASRHRGNPIVVGSRVLFPDGASCDDYGGDIRQEPSPIPYERLKVQRTYWRERLRRMEDDFQRLKGALTGSDVIFNWDPRRYGPSTGDGIADLKHLKGLVEQYRRELTKIEEALAETPEAKSLRDREELDARIKAEQQARLVAQRVKRIPYRNLT